MSSPLSKPFRLGKIYDLGQVHHAGMPTFPTVKPAYTFALSRRHADTYGLKGFGPRSGSQGIIITPEHVGTHIDALCHQAFNMVMYGGVKVSPQNETNLGYTVLGAETIPPIVGMGVLLDVPALKNLEHLPQEYSITDGDLQDCCSAQGVRISRGDTVLVRTGYGRMWNDPDQYMKAAGVGKKANLWLDDKGVFALGVDNVGWDTPGEIDPETGSASHAHVYLIPKKGVYIMENLYLEELAGDRTYTFLLMASSPKLKGATGAPVRPIAIKIQ